MSAVNIQEYIPTIRKILKESDLKKITAKDVRMKLEELFKVDLTSRKPEVQQLVEQCFDELDVSEDEDGEKQSTNQENKKIIKTSKKKNKKVKSKPEKTIASEYSSLEDDHPPEQKKKRGRPKNGVSDATGEGANGKKQKPKVAKKKSNKRKKNDEIDEGDDGEEVRQKKKANTGIHKPLLLSPVLSDFLGVEELSRLDVVKRLWTYIKDNNLQDPKDKRYIICDKKLERIFGKDRMHSFTMNKYLTDHLKKKEDIVGNGFNFVKKDVDQGSEEAYDREDTIQFGDHDADATVKFEDADEFGGDGPIKMEDEFSVEDEGSIKMEDLFGPDDEEDEDNASTKNGSPE